MQVALRTLVVIGVGMIIGDGVLTPSISVLSSIEGLAVAAPGNPSLQKGQRAHAPRCARLRHWLMAAVWHLAKQQAPASAAVHPHQQGLFCTVAQ